MYTYREANAYNTVPFISKAVKMCDFGSGFYTLIEF